MAPQHRGPVAVSAQRGWIGEPQAPVRWRESHYSRRADAIRNRQSADRAEYRDEAARTPTDTNDKEIRVFRLLESPHSDGVARHNARAHFTQRLVLAASVCRELQDAPEDSIIGRPQAALQMLAWWMRTVYDLPEQSHIDYAHGLDHPRLEEFASDLKPELEAGARVCQALAMAYTADKEWERASDLERIRGRLAEYWSVAATDSP